MTLALASFIMSLTLAWKFKSLFWPWESSPWPLTVFDSKTDNLAPAKGEGWRSAVGMVTAGLAESNVRSTCDSSHLRWWLPRDWDHLRTLRTTSSMGPLTMQHRVRGRCVASWQGRKDGRNYWKARELNGDLYRGQIYIYIYIQCVPKKVTPK